MTQQQAIAQAQPPSIIDEEIDITIDHSEESEEYIVPELDFN